MTAPEPVSLRARWRLPEPSIGLWHRIAFRRASDIVAQSGFDWVCIDMQHGAFGSQEVETMLAALAVTGTPAMVRVPWHDPGSAMKALDAGASGILVPVIRTAEETSAMVRACRHPPHGYRSWAARGLADTPGAADELIACGVMIETRESIENLDAILGVDGLDFAFVGPDDLAIAHGLAPSLEPTDPGLVKTIEDVATRCGELGVAAGIYCGSVDMAERWVDRGFRILAATSDETMLRTALADAAQQMRTAAEQRQALRGAKRG